MIKDINFKFYALCIAFFFVFLAMFLYLFFISPLAGRIKKDQKNIQLLQRRVEDLEAQLNDIKFIDKSFTLSSDAILSFVTYYNPTLDKEYAIAFSELATSLMQDTTMIKYPSIFLIALATIGVESGFQLDAQNSQSSARGLGQIIYHYHPWLKDYGILQDDLTTNLEKSMYATYLILLKYWEANNFSYRKMLFKYRGRNYDKYYSKIMEYTVFLTARIIHTSFKDMEE